jgi:hypothetical protein
MTKFARTFITSLIVLGGASMAHAADDTFTTTLKVDTTATVDATYASLEKQAKLTCRREISRSGYSMATVPATLKRKCETQVLTRAVKATNSSRLIALHNDHTGVKVKTLRLAKN